MATKAMSNYLASGLLGLSTVLAAANWYLKPERAVAWATALGLLACMTVAFLLVIRRSKDESAGRSSDESVRSGVAWAGLILAVTLGAKLASTLGAANGADLQERIMMAILGACIVFTGNTIPKTLTRLPALEEDAARVQALRRFAGWTWVLTGLAFAIAWLALPVELSVRLSFVLLPGGMLIIGAQVIRMRRTRQRTI
jgi:uncharacterized membrane protein